jgi:hypothetical protein
MDHAKISSRLLLNHDARGTGFANVHRSHAKPLREPWTEIDGAGECDDLTPCEAAFVEALVDHMLEVGNGTSSRAAARPDVYFDSTLADHWARMDGPSLHAPAKGMGPRERADPGGASSTLYRVGMATADLYCMRAFGRRFVDIPDIERRNVLRLLDSIKLVYPDGSQAGVFFALVYQTLVKKSFAGW